MSKSIKEDKEKLLHEKLAELADSAEHCRINKNKIKETYRDDFLKKAKEYIV